MQNFFHSSFGRGAERVVLLGSDSPNLPKEFVSQAFQMLASHKVVVLGPADDGGYYLIGLALAPVPPIFEGIAWSTPTVWDQTVAILRANEIPFACLPTWYDVDRLADLRRLACDLQKEKTLDSESRQLLSLVGIDKRSHE